MKQISLHVIWNMALGNHWDALAEHRSCAVASAVGLWVCGSKESSWKMSKELPNTLLICS